MSKTPPVVSTLPGASRQPGVLRMFGTVAILRLISVNTKRKRLKLYGVSLITHKFMKVMKGLVCGSVELLSLIATYKETQ